ncbi:MAG: M23 family metallopeptidase, partial [Oscillospiraceae bacterium]
NLYSNLENVYILPIRSDPLSIDGDGDGLLDCTENTLVTKYTGKDDIRAFLYDDNPLRKETIFEWPVKFLDGGKATYISSSFTEYECEERNGKAHCAIDIVAPNNTPVYASIPGKVTYAGYANSWGNTVEILSVVNGRILLTKYNHLNEVLVNTGDEVVSADTLIGKVGNTGYSFGNHLDFIVCDITNGFDGNIENYVGTQCQSFGTTINPLLFNKTIEWSDRNDFSTKKIKTINRNIYDSIMNFPKNLYHSCNDSKCTQCKVSADEINERFLFK